MIKYVRARMDEIDWEHKTKGIWLWHTKKRPEGKIVEFGTKPGGRGWSKGSPVMFFNKEGEWDHQRDDQIFTGPFKSIKDALATRTTATPAQSDTTDSEGTKTL